MLGWNILVYRTDGDGMVMLEVYRRCIGGVEYTEGQTTVEGWIATEERVRLTALCMGGAEDAQFTNQKPPDSLPPSYT